MCRRVCCRLYLFALSRREATQRDASYEGVSHIDACSRLDKPKSATYSTRHTACVCSRANTNTAPEHYAFSLTNFTPSFSLANFPRELALEQRHDATQRDAYYSDVSHEDACSRLDNAKSATHSTTHSTLNLKCAYITPP